MNGKTVAVAMSGGVDSSVAAALLKEQGFNVSGIMMKLWDGSCAPDTSPVQSCYGPGETLNIELAQRISEKLGIRLDVIDCSKEFRSEVLEYVSQEYASGRTPNPCVRCNRHIKFDVLMKKAEANGVIFDFFATGHYCRVEYEKSVNRYLLKKGTDLKKDQSYFLAFLSQEQLSRTIFPVGRYLKTEVKKIARRFGIEAADRPESQDFIAAGYRSVIGKSIPGTVKNNRGEILGGHKGIADYTIGQRKGLGISSPEPMYVIDISPETGDIIVGSKEETYKIGFTASRLNWIGFKRLENSMTLSVKIRYTHPGAEASIIPLEKDRVRVTFNRPQMAITPGQAAVFYNDDTVIGGGIIDR